MTTEQKHHYWLQHFKQWALSQLPQKEYCKQHNLNIATFGYWRTKLCRKAPVKPKLIPVTIHKPSPWIKVFLPNGIRLEIQALSLPDILPLLNHAVQEASDAAS
jgi:hypothetical protein